MNHRLYSRSIEIILENQSIWGSYIASPSFPTYHYCWLRDSSYIAYAMDLVGQHESAQAYFRWVGNTINRYAKKVNVIEKKIGAGKEIGRDEVLHTRYTLDGHEGVIDNTWGNFQIDGYGSWLWALSEHVRRTGNYELLNELEASINTTIQFLRLTWKIPNYDCWEEHPEYIHPYSLACVYGGLNSINSLINEGHFRAKETNLEQLCSEVRDFIKSSSVVDGRLIKYLFPPQGKEAAKPVLNSGVDANLLGMAFPNRVFASDDPIMVATVKEIESKLLRKDGGVYRFQADVYFGGGEWILLTAWLGYHFAETGQKEKAAKLLGWIEAQADSDLNLPEQVSGSVLFPDHYQPWVNKWGPIANPLLWSHAMYLILYTRLQEY